MLQTANQCPVIGIAAFPHDADSYYALFNCADHALYHVKTTQKGSYTLYTPEIMKSSLLTVDATAIAAGIDSNTGSINAQLTEYIFNLLYFSPNVKEAIPNILELIGKTYNVCNVCIYEQNSIQTNCGITYEWFDESAASFQNTIRDCLNLTGNDCYFEHFNKNGIFYCPDTVEVSNHFDSIFQILAGNGFSTLLQFLIMDHCEVYGFIGFHHCQSRYPLSQEQIHSLGLLSRILSVFILKARAEGAPTSSMTLNI